VILNNFQWSSKKEPTIDLTFWIDKTELPTSPTTCVHYQDGYSADKVYNMIINFIKPSVVKDASVNYFLNKSNLGKKADGTASVLTGADGDVCISVPILWYSITDTSDKKTFRISDMEFDGAVTAHKYNGEIHKYIHYGMFPMSSNPVSIAGSTTTTRANSIWNTVDKPCVSQTHDTMRTDAEARGDYYGLMTLLSWSLFQILILAASGSTNSQNTIGESVTSATVYPSADPEFLTCGGYVHTYYNRLMYLFLAYPWGNTNNTICGALMTNNSCYACTDQAKARGVSATSTASDLPSGWVNVNPASYYFPFEIKDMYVHSLFPFIPNYSTGGTTSTYYCDSGKIDKSTSYNTVVTVGGTSGGSAGLFNFGWSLRPTQSYWDVGARIQIIDREVVV